MIPLKILHLEDDEKDAIIIKKTIQEEFEHAIIKKVDTQGDYETELKKEKFDLILSDFSLPGFDGIKALNIAQKLVPETPYIYVSGHIGEDRAIDALKLGATDYVLKDKLVKLIPAIKRALKEVEVKEENKRIENNLKESEEKFRTIVNNFPVVLFMTDENGIATFSRGKGFEISGIKSENLVGANIADMYKGISFKLINGIVISGKEAFNNALRGEIQNGVIFLNDRFYETKLLPYFDDLKNIKGIIGISLDVTELISTQNQLKESEETFRKIFESAPIGMARLTSNGNYLSANLVLQKMLGYSEEELKSMNLDDITFGEDKIKSKEMFYNLISDESNYVKFEKRYITKSGKIIWTNITSTAVKNKEGNILFLITMIENINERKEAEIALKESETRFKDLAALLPLTVFEINLTRQITYVNKTGLKTFLYSEEDIQKGLTIDKIPHSKDLKFIFERFEQVLKGKQFGGLEFTAVRNDGTEFPCIVYSNAILKDDRPAGIRGILIDNTERHNTLEELVMAKERAEEMNKLKTIFLANMSHELRTPLIGILGFADILKEELKKEENMDMVNTIYDSGTRLLETLNLILDLSRIEAGKVQILYKAFDVIEVVKELVKLFQSISQKKELYLKIETPFEKLEVELDERMFHSVIKNLISNAVKYTAKGGVTIKIEFEERKENGILIVGVSDTGIGISEENQEIIFDEFRQISEGYSRNFEGTGLGLTIAKNFVQKMGGDIKLKSRQGKGSTFKVSLPAKVINIKSAEKENTPESVLKDVAASEKNNIPVIPEILLVDDDDITASVIKLYFKNIYIIDWAIDGEAALEKVNTKRYDLILMDVNLKSNLNGMDVTKLIRSIPDYKDTPIIACTAYAMKSDKKKFLDAGCTDYLSKPFTRDQLKKTIDSVLTK